MFLLQCVREAVTSETESLPRLLQQEVKHKLWQLLKAVVSSCGVCCSEGLVSWLRRGSQHTQFSLPWEADQATGHYFCLYPMTGLKEAFYFCGLLANGCAMPVL